MLAKLTSKNQLTLPKAVMQQVGATDYFEISTENGKIILTPFRVHQADAVRTKLKNLNINEDDITDAIAWGRQAQA